MVPFLLRRATSADYMLAALFLSVPAAYLLHESHGAHGFGPRFYFEVFFCLYLLGARAFMVLATIGAGKRGAPTLAGATAAALFGILLLSSASVLPSRLDLYRGYNHVDTSLEEEIQRLGIERGLILFDSNQWQEWGRASRLLTAHLDADIVFAKAGSENRLLLQRYQDRDIFFWSNGKLSPFRSSESAPQAAPRSAPSADLPRLAHLLLWWIGGSAVLLLLRRIRFEPSVAVGLGLVALAVCMIRAAEGIPSILAWGLPDFLSPLRFPETLPLALLAAVAGLFVLFKRSEVAKEVVGPELAKPAPRGGEHLPKGVGWWLLVAALICAELVVFELKGVATPWAFPLWIFPLLLGGIFLWNFDRRRRVDLGWRLQSGEWIFLLLASALGLVYWLHDVYSWKYSMIGDETGFYAEAVRWAQGGWKNINSLEASGVFQDHPVMVTAIQGFFMKVFGVSALSWKASCAALALLGLPFLYLFVRANVGKLGAALAGIVYVFSIPVTAWAKIGKPHAFLLAPVPVTLGLIHLSRRGSLLYAFLSGVAAGSGFFLFVLGGMASTAVLAVGCTLRVLREGEKRRSALSAATAFVGWFISAFPILIQVDYFQHLFVKNLSSPNMAYTAILNSVHGLAAFFYFEASDHFVFGNVCDAFSAVLILIGIGFVVRQRLLLSASLLPICLFLSCTLAYYSYPPMTRLHLLAPAWAVLAGYGAAFVLKGLRPFQKWIGVAVLTLSIAGLNAWVWASNDRLINHHQFIVRAIQSLESRQSYIYLVPPGWNVMVGNEAFRYLEVDVKSVPEAEAFNALKSAGAGSSLGVFLHPRTRLSDEAIRLLGERKVPVYVPGFGHAKELPVWPPTLAPADMQSYRTTDPGRLQRPLPETLRAKTDAAFIQTRLGRKPRAAADQRKGLLRTLYSGADWMGDPISVDVVDGFHLPDDAPRPFSALWQGILTVERNTDYRLRLASDDGAFLLIDDQVVIDNLGVHSVVSKSAQVQLEEGPHRFEIGYYESGGFAHLECTFEILDQGSDYIHVEPLLYAPEAAGER